MTSEQAGCTRRLTAARDPQRYVRRIGKCEKTGTSRHLRRRNVPESEPDGSFHGITKAQAVRLRTVLPAAAAEPCAGVYRLVASPNTQHQRWEAGNMKKYSVLLGLLLLVECPSSSDESAVTSHDSFVVTLENGKAFRITPNIAKLKNIGNLAFHSDSISPVRQQFERQATTAVLREAERNPNLDIAQVVFAQVTGRHESGESFRPLRFH